MAMSKVSGWFDALEGTPIFQQALALGLTATITSFAPTLLY